MDDSDGSMGQGTWVSICPQDDVHCRYRCLCGGHIHLGHVRAIETELLHIRNYPDHSHRRMWRVLHIKLPVRAF